jgi:hypothetical protein
MRGFLEALWIRHSAAATAMSIIMVMLLPAPARAVFTTDEVQSLVQLRSASAQLLEGLRDYLAPAVDGSRGRTRQDLREALRAGLAASREVTLAAGLLLDVITEQVDTEQYEALTRQSRGQRVGLAWWRLDRAESLLASAQHSLDHARGKTREATLEDAIRRASQIWVPGARHALADVDRRLTYGDARPSSYPAIIGPHGDFDRAQWFLWRSQHYAHDALDSLTADGWTLAIAEPLKRISLAIAIDLDAMLRLAGVSWTQEQGDRDPFFATLDVLEQLTASGLLPKRWMEAVVALTGWARTAAGQAATIRVADAWKHADMAAWMLMVFRNCSPERNPTGCGGRTR